MHGMRALVVLAISAMAAIGPARAASLVVTI
jgi:hypothetical protein